MLDDLFRPRENAEDVLEKTFGVKGLNEMKTVIPKEDFIQQFAFNFAANMIDRVSMLDDSQRMHFWNDIMEELETSGVDYMPLLAFIVGVTMASLYVKNLR